MSNNKQSLLQSKGIRSNKPISLPKNTFRKNSLKRKPISQVGETRNFVVDYDNTEKLVLVYGKESPSSHRFKLGLDEKEVSAMINLLKQSRTLFPQ
jgi:hypothetical protein